jgi:hypothetical protein
MNVGEEERPVLLAVFGAGPEQSFVEPVPPRFRPGGFLAGLPCGLLRRPGGGPFRWPPLIEQGRIEQRHVLADLSFSSRQLRAARLPRIVFRPSLTPEIWVRRNKVL